MLAPADTDLALSELVESDVDLLESAMKVPSLGDARAFQRYAFRGRARAVVFPPHGSPREEPQEYEVITTDVSRGGLSVLHRQQLYPGQQVLLVLNGANRLIEVCWCCCVWPGLYSAGCKFVSSPPVPAEEA
jgi:PilZ domain-containing protein